MPSFYSVVQFVPDAIRDERMNFGVVAFDDTALRVQFLSNWTRASRFADSDIAFLREFAKSMETACSQQQGLFDESRGWTPDAIREAAEKWSNSIQFTEPRASTLGADELLPRMSTRYLAPARSPRPPFRDRRTAVKLARTNIARAMKARGAEASQLSLNRGVRLVGAHDSHRFDLGIKNGNLLHGIQGISFEGPPRKELDLEVDATAWSISDVHETNPEFPVTIVALPPSTTSTKKYKDARRVFESLNAEFIEELDVPHWAENSVAALIELQATTYTP